MDDKDRELMERYIYAVVRRLPKEQRSEVGMELSELIEDMAKDAPMEEVLYKLGDPAVFARKYRGENDYLIGPDYYDNYAWVLKIVLLCVLASAAVSGVIEGIADSDWTWNVVKSMGDNLTMMLSNMAVNAFKSTIMAVGAVTLIFAVMERLQMKADLKKDKEWSVRELEDNPVSGKKMWKPVNLGPVPDKRALISRGESVVSIVFAAVFCGLLLFAPYLLGAYVFDENHQLVKTIPLFNLEKWNLILPVFLASLLIGFIDDLIKLVKGCYCSLVLVSGAITGALQLGLLIVALKILPFWNLNFMEELKRHYNFQAESAWDIMSYYGTDAFSNIVLIIMACIIFLELGTTVYKTVRFGTE